MKLLLVCVLAFVSVAHASEWITFNANGITAVYFEDSTFVITANELWFSGNGTKWQTMNVNMGPMTWNQDAKVWIGMRVDIAVIAESADLQNWTTIGFYPAGDYSPTGEPWSITYGKSYVAVSTDTTGAGSSDVCVNVMLGGDSVRDEHCGD